MDIDNEMLNSLAAHINSLPCSTVDGVPISALHISSPCEQHLQGRLFVGDDILPPRPTPTHQPHLPKMAPLPPRATQIVQNMTCMYGSCAGGPAKTYSGIVALSKHLSEVHKVSCNGGRCRFPECNARVRRSPGLLVHVLAEHVGLYLKCRHAGCTRYFTVVNSMRSHWVKAGDHPYDANGALYDECLRPPTSY